MTELYWADKDLSIGPQKFPDRKKPCLVVRHGNVMISYGSFLSDKAAEDFMNELATALGVTEHEQEN